MANKERLIDVNAIPESATAISADGRLFVAWSAIENAPTVDAEPVVYAHWEDEYGGKFANPRWRCSACKEKALYAFEVDSLGNEVEKQELSTRCPECGAHMYRERKENA
jgi:rubrerythrin